MQKLQFHKRYFIIALALFLVEVLIATVFKDWFILRAYIGDVLVVILLYYLIKAFIKINNNGLLILGIFIFSIIVEVLQLLHMAEWLGFQKGSVAYIVMGNSFSWVDIACYGAGCIVLLIVNRFPKLC